MDYFEKSYSYTYSRAVDTLQAIYLVMSCSIMYYVFNDLFPQCTTGYEIWDNLHFPMLNPHRQLCKYGPHLIWLLSAPSKFIPSRMVVIMKLSIAMVIQESVKAFLHQTRFLYFCPVACRFFFSQHLISIRLY